MPFHVEIARSFRRAWAFNLSEDELARGVVEPWRRGAPIALGDREWSPRQSSVRILEGPELVPQALSFGQGWNNAERSAREVTEELLGGASIAALAVAVHAGTAADRRIATELLERLGLRAVEWERTGPIETGRPPAGVAAALLVVEQRAPSERWLLDAGLALGALGSRAVVVALPGRRVPRALEGLPVVRVEPDSPESLAALGERLGRPVGGSPTPRSAPGRRS